MEDVSKKLGRIALAGTCIAAGLGLAASGAMAASSIDTWNIYYGHLHNHTTVSDGSGSPDQAYSTAKAAGLDFFSTADHAESTSDTEYNTVQNTADAYNQDGVFTTFWGFEWSSSTHGHVTVTNTADICRSSESATNTFSELVNWLSSREAVAFFNHPGRESNAFEHYDGTVSDKFVGMELWNKQDFFDVYYYNDGFHSGDNNMGHYDEALLRGWDIGASGAEDNHGTDWGTDSSYAMAILADNQTRTDLYNAMKARRFFSTADKNLGLYFDMDGYVMGSQIDGGTNSVTIKANDGDSETVDTVELLKNGVVINTWYPNSSTPVITDTVSSVAGDYFYCRIMQADGDEAISSPVFITTGTPVDADNDGYDSTVDCNDNDAAINPGAVENCTDGIDNDCDNLIDAQDPDAQGCPLVCTDDDADSYSLEGGDCGAVDCNDLDALINPAAVENCTDGVDNDCDGLEDCNDSDCSTDPNCQVTCSDYTKRRDCTVAGCSWDQSTKTCY